MKVKLLISRASNEGAQNIGDEVEVSLAEYEAMLAAGHCGEYPEAAAQQAESEAAERAEAERIADEAAAQAEAERQGEVGTEAAVAINDAETATAVQDAETATPKRKPERA